MNRFGLICSLVIISCMVLIGVACKIAGSAWYEWLIMLSLSFTILIKCISGDWPKSSLPMHEQHLRCARCSHFAFSTLGIASVILGVIDGVFGDVVILLLSMAVTWLSVAHFSDKKGKFFWWLGWTVTMSGFACLSISDMSGISSEVRAYVLYTTLGALAITLIAGLVLYIYPPVRKLADDVKEIKDTIKKTPLNNG